MALRACTVTYDDGAGIRHTVQVMAETVFEAAVLGLKLLEDNGVAPGSAACLEITAQTPVVNHSVRVHRVRDWISSAGKSPREQALKSRLREVRKSAADTPICG